MSITITKITSSKTASSREISAMATTSKAIYPLHPDVVMKKLPFYIQNDILLKPSSLQPSKPTAKFQEQSVQFHMTPSQTKTIQNSKRIVSGKIEFRHQVQLRFSLLEISCQQTDAFPKSLCVRVNGKVCPLPNPLPAPAGTEPRRPPGPINITNLCKLKPTQQDTISVTWAVEVGKAFTLSVYQVENLTHQDLLEQLRSKGVRNPDYTKALIKEKLNDQDTEIATTSCKVSLACPLGKMRMKIPARASTCDHLQCFDAQLYLMMNEKKPKWVCPVCNKTAEPMSLQIDGFFLNLVTSSRLPSDEHEIVLHNDGSWDPLVKEDPSQTRGRTRTKAEAVTQAVKRPAEEAETITLEENAVTQSVTSRRSTKKPRREPMASNKQPAEIEIECIDID